jgi:hypothetical protein
LLVSCTGYTETDSIGFTVCEQKILSRARPLKSSLQDLCK